MASDEQEIRSVHSTWIDAVNAGDLARLLTFVADDVVFLLNHFNRAHMQHPWAVKRSAFLSVGKSTHAP